MDLLFNQKSVGMLTEIQKKVIQNDIPSEIFEEDMTRRCKYWIEHPLEKYVHLNRDSIIKSLKEKGKKTIPADDIQIIKEFALANPCKYGYEDLKEDIECKVGNQSFSFSKECRVGWRKKSEKDQENCSKEEFLLQEEKMLGERMNWILQHKYERCMGRLRFEWTPRLQSLGIKEIPLDDDEFAQLVFSQKDYKNRSQREEENRGV